MRHASQVLKLLARILLALMLCALALLTKHMDKFLQERNHNEPARGLASTPRLNPELRALKLLLVALRFRQNNPWKHV